MYDVLSVPTHENIDSIIDLIKNINKFMKKPFIILHIPPDYVSIDFFLKLQEETSCFSNVIINEEMHTSCLFRMSNISHNLGNIHLSNYKCAIKHLRYFNTFSLYPSNGMFVRSGVEQLFSKYDYGMVLTQPPEHPDCSILHPNIAIKLKINPCDVTKIVWEGAWFKQHIFNMIYEYLTSIPYNDLFYSAINMLPEELVFSSALQYLTRIFNMECNTTTGFLRMWCATGENAITIEYIKNIIYQNYDIPDLGPTCVYVPLENIYAVKRVSRDINDPLRAFINSIQI